MMKSTNEISKKFKLGSIKWQDEMKAMIKNKKKENIPLDDTEKIFLETQKKHEEDINDSH